MNVLEDDCTKKAESYLMDEPKFECSQFTFMTEVDIEINGSILSLRNFGSNREPFVANAMGNP